MTQHIKTMNRLGQYNQCSAHLLVLFVLVLKKAFHRTAVIPIREEGVFAVVVSSIIKENIKKKQEVKSMHF